MLADEWNFCWRGWEEQTEKPGNISVGRMGMQIQTAAQSYSKGYYYVCMTVFFIYLVSQTSVFVFSGLHWPESTVIHLQYDDNDVQYRISLIYQININQQ